jgi:hypothetical protein
MRPDGGLPGHQAEQLGPSGQRHARITMLCWHHDPDHAQGRRHASRAASLGTSKVGAEIRSTRPMVREPLEVTLSGDLDPVIRKRLAEVVQSVQSYCRLAELEIAAGERPRTGDVALSEDTATKAKEWAEEEAEGERQREAFMGKLRAVGKDPRTALEEMGG